MSSDSRPGALSDATPESAASEAGRIEPAHAVADSLSEWLAWMESHHPRSIELGLDRVAAVLERLRLDFSAVPIITVAGTNGKGSCVAAAVAALRAAGRRVGSYTSPHLVHYNERVCIDGQPLDDNSLCQGFARVHAALEGDSLTYFEFGTLAALVNFAAAEVDVLVLEVGLGGRLDAVNSLDSDVAVITSIDLDHRDWLGDDRELIGAEKAGIARAGRPLLCADPAPPASIAATAAAVDAVLMRAGVEFGVERETEAAVSTAAAEDAGYRFYGRNRGGESWQLHGPLPRLSVGSVACALQAVALLDIPVTSAMLQAACTAELPGRFQRVILDEIEVILDVAHNPAAAAALAARLAELPTGRTAALFGAMADKDVDGVVEALRERVDAWFIAELKDVPRALPAPQLAARIHSHGIHMISVSKNLRQAWRRALSLLAPGDRLLVCGSFHIVGPVISWLDDELDKRRRRASP